MPRITRLLHPIVPLIALSLVLTPPDQTWSQQPASKPTTPSASQPVRRVIYDTQADAKAQIAAAVDRAKRENQRVLVMFGGNWCGWCHKLHGLFKSDADIAKTLQYEYQLVLIDVGKLDKNLDLAAGYGADLKKSGVPLLVVVGADGKVVSVQETGTLEEGDHHDPKKVAAFLEKWEAPAADAEKLLADTLARAEKEEKLLFVHLGAPWCGWCRKLDEFLARKEIAEIIGRDFIDLKIDVDRMKNAKGVVEQLRKSKDGGIPWFVFLDPHGLALATSDGPDGNVGFPATPEEISHFVSMLKKTVRRIKPEQISQIEKALKEAAAKPRGVDR